MFCSKCGNRNDSENQFCAKCGYSIQGGNSGNGKNTAALICGIIGLLFCLSGIFGYEEIIHRLQEEAQEFGLGFIAFGAVFIQVILGIVALCLSLSVRKTIKSNMSIASIILAIAIFLISAVEIFLIVNYQ